MFSSLQAFWTPFCCVGEQEWGDIPFHTVCLLHSFSTLFETESLTEMQSGALSGRDWLVSDPQVSSWLHLPKNKVLGTCHCALHQEFFRSVNVGDPNSGLHGYTRSALPTLFCFQKCSWGIFWRYFDAKCTSCLSCLAFVLSAYYCFPSVWFILLCMVGTLFENCDSWA